MFTLIGAIVMLSLTTASAWQDGSDALFDGLRIVLLHSATDDTQCLALPDDTPGPWERVIMKPCQTGDKSMRWRLQFGQTTISPAVDSQPWCLDGGNPADEFMRISVDVCDGNKPNQAWFFTEDQHLAVKDQERCLDLKDGDPDAGGWLQTFAYSSDNTNQIWIPELADI